MISVTIIGILAVVSVPSYQENVRNARSAELYSILRSADVAQQLYHYEYGTFLFSKSATSLTAYQNMRAGLPITIDGGESVEMKLVWNVLDLYPMNMQVHWYMVQNQGKFYEDGSAAQFNDTWDQGPIEIPRYREYTTFQSQLTSNGQSVACTQEPVAYTLDPTDRGAESAPGRAYDWVSVGIGTSFLSSDPDDCTSLSKLKIYDSATQSYNDGPYIRFDKVFN